MTLLSLGIALAQEFIVFGQVLDATNQEPIQAANVWFKGTQIGSSTNEEGYFILRTSAPQKTVCVSVLGYKRREINMAKNSNQMVTILLREERNILDEVIVMPGENEALPILRNVLAARDKNNPDNFLNLSTAEDQKTKLFFINIKQRSLQRKLFRDMLQGSIRGNDSLLIIPVYHEQKYDELRVQRQELYKSAVPYLTKALEIDSKNISAAKTLMNIYSIIGETAKHNIMKAKVEALEAAN